MTINRKWRYLTLGAGWDRHIVPVYEASAGSGRVPLLKTLLTSICKNDCKYCAFRSHRICHRERWEAEELVKVTLHLWMRGKIEGLFLSSTVYRDPDYTTERQLEVLRILRDSGYDGYIHLRLMPGVDRSYIREAVQLADRVGINLEAPNSEIFSELCPDKGEFENDVIKRLEWISSEVKRMERERESSRFGYGRAGVDTQIIVGAVDDNDLQYIKVSEWLYREAGLRRIYYSGFEPVLQTPLENRPVCPLSREYRLYQASFLIRDYGFRTEDFIQIIDERGFLPNIDPKLALAKKNPDMFPVDLNTASYGELLRIPGIGPERAKRIMEVREKKRIHYLSDVERIFGLSLARAISPYITLKDRKILSYT